MNTWSFVLGFVLFIFMAFAAIQDWKTHKVEHWPILCMYAVSLLHLLITKNYALLWGLLPCFALACLYLLKQPGMGGADIKMIGAIGLYVGHEIGIVLCIACLLGVIQYMAVKLWKGRKITVPLCTWLAISAFVYIEMGWIL